MQISKVDFRERFIFRKRFIFRELRMTFVHKIMVAEKNIFLQMHSTKCKNDKL